MIRILFYTDSPGYGGAERQMETLAQLLGTMGYSVSLACASNSALANRKEELRGVYEEVFVISALHKHDPRHYFGLKRILRDEKFDLLHIHLWNPGACRYAFFAGKAIKTPIVTTEHDPFRLHGLKGAIERMCLSRADRIIAISHDNVGQLSDTVGNWKTRVVLIHNGIDLGRFLDNHDKVSLPVEAGSIVITCNATLHARKGHKYLIEAFLRLQEDYPMLHLVLASSGPLEQELIAHYGANPNIHFIGWREDIPQILKATDIFVLPSLREAFGLALVEAMASEVPVVATRTSGPKDIVEDGKSGLLVPPGDSDSLAEAIRTLLNNPGQRKDLAKNGQERAKTLFTAERMAKETATVYQSIFRVQ